MADTIRKCDYFAIQVPNRAGEGARLLNGLKAAGVNLLAFTGFPNGRKAQVDFIAERSAGLQSAAKKMKLSLGKKKTCFVIQGDDRVGAIADIMDKLGKARINVTCVDGVAAGQGRYGAILWVKPKDVVRAAKVLGAK
ncbi:MAG: hypothetical protein HYU77_12260 [Betaproteobacteria bacterium]|nr:hypothetical protein [Betaproteobacteria bacterium]